MNREALTEIIEINSAGSFTRAIERATDILRNHGVVAVPTETVYGLAGNALDSESIARIFAVKGRPSTNPLIVHVAGLDMARQCVSSWTSHAQRLSEAFWPGPLTLVLSRSDIIPDLVTGGGSTVAIRWPSHPFMNALIKSCDFPLSAPSANLSGAISSTNARHVMKNLAAKIPLIIDGGQSQFGIESTVIDLTVEPPAVLRPGVITSSMLSEALGRDVGNLNARTGTDTPFRSPGLLTKHYAPRAKLLLWEWENEKELKARLREQGYPPEKCHVISHTRVPFAGGYGRVSVIPNDPEAFGRAIYAELHHADESTMDFIVLEALPDSIEWAAIRDRLCRASAE